MDYKILRAPAIELVPDPQIPFVDIHGVFEDCLDYIIPDDDAPVQNLLFNSDHGLGKSLLCAHLIKKLGMELGYDVPMITHDCSEDDRAWTFSGAPVRLPSGETGFQLGPFPAVIDLANEVGYAALVLEEISALSPGAQKICNKMTDWRTGIYVTEIGKMYKLRPGATVVVLANMNPSTYGGVYSMNKDLRSRFGEERLVAPTQSQMVEILQQVCPWAKSEVIKKAAQLAEETRADALEDTLSPRDLVHFLQKAKRKKWKLESPLRQIVNRFEGTEMKTVADRINAIFSTRLVVSGGSAEHV
jgi:MoxR-like ATPase